MLQETKRETWDRRFVSSVWKGKRVEWAALPACGASGGIVILWDSSKFECTEKVLGSFSVTVKFNSGEEGSFWLTSVYGPINPLWRKDFWLELQDLYGLTFPRCFQEALPRWTSDHSPICLETNPLKWGPTPFRFENMWLLHPEFKEKFRVWWQECTGEGWEGHKFMRKLKFVKSKLKEWNIMTFGDLKERKKLILTDLSRIDLIEQEGNLNSDLVLERTLRRRELEDVLLKEEVQWRQKSRVKWIKEGDCNSKFFHRVATGRRSRKFIKSLISERGETLNNIEDISEEIVNFFGNLYSKPVGESWRVEGIDWVPISGESGVWLDRPFTEEEVRMAVFQLNKEKAPGPNGFTIAVYQECWDVIKEDLMRVFLEFHTNGVLSGRLRKVLHETISGSQGAFIEGRHILDAVLIANEVVDEKRRSGEEGIVFKIDFEKAYDHVDWGFLDHVLQRKGSSRKWRSWIRGCLSSSSFAILVNGNAKGWVKASRGLRQGDPLSPFLFTLVADVLSRMLFRAEETGFTEASMEHLQNLKIILLVFGQVSGLKINLEKSTISGLPLGGNPKTIGFWDPVVERISRRLDGWKKAYLSLGGRITGREEKSSCQMEVVSRPKESGGLGFGKISLRNIALLGKWLWRFPRERSGLWHKVIGSIYGTCPNGWDANMVVRWSHRCPWKAIAQVFQEFSPFVRLVVGNGERIRFWEDLWWGNQSLCSQFVDLYRVISVKNLTVSNVLGNSFPLAWNLNFRRNLTDSEIDLLQRLMSSLTKFLWSSKVPSKVKALAWIVAHGKVNTNDKLQLRRPYKSLCPQWCILCKGNGESIDHLFLLCPVTIGLWNKLFKLAGLDWVPPRSFEDMLVITFKGLGNSLRGKTLWQVACLTLVWIVWQERNNRIFEDKGRSEETLWDLILFYSTLWASCSAAFRGVPLNVLQLNWSEVVVKSSWGASGLLVEGVPGWCFCECHKKGGFLETGFLDFLNLLISVEACGSASVEVWVGKPDCR
ncbi:LINE-1 retrotransposable element ORF2 protein [Vitis vinifera]|uniref:LINE-1 retrotransposable element ORF2 protein n=1 Tax=Vitis vinifera TaxID=29760 RepID=A0A438JK46_VITVI|nr:LINE-1 retrotransposable element ORF2 protein [Vitis vinifera]